MIEWLWNRTLTIATGWNFFLLLLFVCVFNLALFAPRVATYPDGGSFDGRWKGFRPSEAQGIVHMFDRAGKLDTYINQEETMDLIFPVVYTLLLAVGIVGCGKAMSAPHWLIAFPYIAGLADYCENFSVIAMVSRYRATASVPYSLAFFAASASRVKWIFTGLSFILLVSLAVIRLLRRNAQNTF
jgi:hypothetical protein